MAFKIINLGRCQLERSYTSQEGAGVLSDRKQNTRMRMYKRVLPLLVSVMLLMISCGEKQKEDQVKAVDKNGSVEMKVAISHLNEGQDVMKTEKIYWIGGKAVKTVVNLDTVPALGTTNQVVQNSAGEDSTATIKKNYQIFITVL
jgi:hypothetical protein